MHQTPPLRIAVVGGGIAGLSAALSIQKLQAEGANVELKMFEQAPKFAEIGAGVAFGANAQRALGLIGCGEALERVANTPGIDPDFWYEYRIGDAKHPQSGKSIVTIRYKNAAKGGVHRADFLDQMIARLRDREKVAHFNHICTGYTSHADGITLHFSNQPDQEADVVIASDGVKSRIRHNLYEKAGLDIKSQVARYAEWVAWRGLISRADFERAMGAETSLKEMLLGRDRHILHFPVKNGEMVNIVAFVRDPEHKKLGGRTGPWAEERPKEEMMEDFASFRPDCQELLKAIKKPSVWGIFAVPELSTATGDRLALIGDAARAMTPHQGAGAGQAVEDALFLTTLLCSDAVAAAPAESRSKQIGRALEAYDRVRHPRGRDVQRTSREAGLLYEFAGVKGEGDDAEKIAAELKDRMLWIWSFDIQQVLKETVASLS